MTFMRISAAGIAAIRQREGFRLEAYPDVRGIPTIGVGHTGPEIHFGLVWTRQQVDAALASDLFRFENAVNTHVKVPLTQNQFDACVSLAYNIGVTGFQGSSVLKQLNRKDYAEAAVDFLMWETPPSLAGRRLGEKAQFLSTNEPDAPVSAPATPVAAPVPIAAALTTSAVGAAGLVSGALVAAALKSLGYNFDENRPLDLINTIKLFQRQNGLESDGVYGPLTKAAMVAALNKASIN